MVALMKNNMKKSTISASSLWRGEGMLYSRPKGKLQQQQNMSVRKKHYETKSPCQTHVALELLAFLLLQQKETSVTMSFIRPGWQWALLV